MLLPAMGLSLVLLSAAVIRASTVTLEEADLYPYSDLYEVHRGAQGDVYVSDAGVGVWRVSASGVYTIYRLFADVLDAKPDAAGDIWYTDGANVVTRINVGAPGPTRTEWLLEETYGLWGLTVDDAGRVWVTQEAGSDLYRFDPTTAELCTYTLGAWSTYVLHQSGDLWLADWGADRIRRLGPSGQLTSWSIPWSGARPLGLVGDGAGGLWWADRGLGALVRLEPGANRMTRYDLPLGTRPQIVDLRGGQVWYSEWTLNAAGTVGVLDLGVATGISTTVGAVNTSVAPECAILDTGTTTPVPEVDVGTLDWISDTLAPALEQDGWTIYQLPEGSRPYGLTDGGTHIWLADRGRGKLARLQPSTLPTPGIALEKRTNGQDADDPPGPVIRVGDPVTWTYAVTNTGDVDLTEVVVSDDNGTPGDNSDDYVCVVGVLPKGGADDSTCWLLGTALDDQHGNVATAVGLAGATSVTDTDASHYFGIRVSIDLEKRTNGQDADDPPGPVIRVGDPVTWTYVVMNTGNVDLEDVVVVDDNGTPADSADDYECAIGSLSAGPTKDTTCCLVGVAAEGPFENLAAVEGFYGELQAQDVDVSHYLGNAEERTVFMPLVVRSPTAARDAVYWRRSARGLSACAAPTEGPACRLGPMPLSVWGHWGPE
jgi:streptogramin lyase